MPRTRPTTAAGAVPKSETSTTSPRSTSPATAPAIAVAAQMIGAAASRAPSARASRSAANGIASSSSLQKIRRQLVTRIQQRRGLPAVGDLERAGVDRRLDSLNRVLAVRWADVGKRNQQGR